MSETYSIRLVDTDGRTSFHRLDCRRERAREEYRRQRDDAKRTGNLSQVWLFEVVENGDYEVVCAWKASGLEEGWV